MPVLAPTKCKCRGLKRVHMGTQGGLPGRTQWGTQSGYWGHRGALRCCE